MFQRRTLLAATPLVALGALTPFTTAQATTSKDINPSDPLYTEITWAIEKGIISGYPDGTLRPAANINGQDLARAIYAYRGKPAYTPPAKSPFVDVSPRDPYFKEIMWLVSQGIATGYIDKTYRPTSGVDRGVFAAYLYRMAGEPSYIPPVKSYFTDVPTDHPYYKEICWLKDAKITAGWPGRTYLPSKLTQQATVCAFLYRYNQILG